MVMRWVIMGKFHNKMFHKKNLILHKKFNSHNSSLELSRDGKSSLLTFFTYVEVAYTVTCVKSDFSKSRTHSKNTV